MPQLGGDMVPLGAVLTIIEVGGPILLMRYNMYPAAAVVGNTQKGVSSGEGITAMENLAEASPCRSSFGLRVDRDQLHPD